MAQAAMTETEAQAMAHLATDQAATTETATSATIAEATATETKTVAFLTVPAMR